MKPVVLLVGRLPNVIGNVAKQLEDLPIQWLGAHTRDEVISQISEEPKIECVIMGASHDDTVRGDLIAVIAQRRPDLCIHIKDRSSGPDGMASFVRRMVQCDVLRNMAHF
ncbi:hypothetical protein A9Q96_05445 [Rhodobacterales bacterium 52_120_T64]|nr:hypothetical protein A9Q96_05445 [Rhodobacterales bacterium 52_120_T64]